LFQQRQTHDIQQDYKVAGLNDSSDVTGWDDTFWLTKQWRVDRDQAVFGEITWDITDKFSVMGGARYFKYENSLEGFFGFGITNPYESSTGEVSCFDTGSVFEDAPCTNLDKTVKDEDSTFKINATYHITDDAMVYFTRSEGFRPGGVNRRGTFPPYVSDFLTNYEVGWKTSWLNDRLRFNGAVYHMTWDDFQFSFLGENGLTNLTNAQGGAELKGVEADLQWAVTDAFSLYGGFAIQKSEMKDDFCLLLGEDGRPLPEAQCLDDQEPPQPTPFTPAGTRLPSTPEFKANLTARYQFNMGGMESYVQGSVVHEGDRRTALLEVENDVLRNSPAYTLLDASFGFGINDWNMELFVKNVTDKRAVLYSYAECDVSICGASTDAADGVVYSVMARPRMVGLKFSQKF
jgi:outer membrane receptor protein involved in Fe transport